MRPAMAPADDRALAGARSPSPPCHPRRGTGDGEVQPIYVADATWSRLSRRAWARTGSGPAHGFPRVRWAGPKPAGAGRSMANRSPSGVSDGPLGFTRSRHLSPCGDRERSLLLFGVWEPHPQVNRWSGPVHWDRRRCPPRRHDDDNLNFQASRSTWTAWAVCARKGVAGPEAGAIHLDRRLSARRSILGGPGRPASRRTSQPSGRCLARAGSPSDDPVTGRRLH